MRNLKCGLKSKLHGYLAHQSKTFVIKGCVTIYRIGGGANQGLNTVPFPDRIFGKTQDT